MVAISPPEASNELRIDLVVVRTSGGNPSRGHCKREAKREAYRDETSASTSSCPTGVLSDDGIVFVSIGHIEDRIHCRVTGPCLTGPTIFAPFTM